MKDFVMRVAQKVSKLTSEQVEHLLQGITQENELLDAVLESISTGLLICANDWTLIKVNKAGERYLRVTGDQYMESAQVWNYISDSDISDFVKENHNRQKNNCSADFSLNTAGGSLRVVEVTMLPLVQKKHLAGNIVKIEDITEKRNQEILLRRNESLASLTNLAASVAHEIKNPLGSISIYIQLIQKALAKARSEDNIIPDKKFAEKYLDIVMQEIERLNNIIVDFLFAVRPIQANPELIDLGALIRSLTDFFKPEFESKQVEVQLNLIENSPKLMLDEKLFKQAIINIVQNAIAAMPSGGVLWFSTRVKNDKLLLSIADNGEGMNETTLCRIFEPYFTTKAKGTGLGLTMVFKIIKEHGGDVEVHSKPGDGTLFSIFLPIPQKERRLLS